MLKRIAFFGAACALALCGAAVIAASRGRAAKAWQVVRRIPVPGDGGWDYLTVDAPSHRLFISRGSHVMVLDVESGQVVGDIPDTAGVHGIAIDGRLDRGFTSNGQANTVTEFDLHSLKPIRTIDVGEGPDCILFDPASSRVFTFNGRAGTSTVIDADTGKVAGTIALGGRPEFAAADGRGHVYDNIEDKSEIVEIDSHSLQIVNRWPVAPAEGPSGLAVDGRNRRLFSVCHSGVMVVMDADTGKVVATPAIGQGPDAAGFDPGLREAFSSNGDGTLTVVREVDPDHFDVVANVPTQRGARTMALDPRTHHVYLCTAQFDTSPPPAGQPAGERRFRFRFVPGSFVVLDAARK